MTDNLAKFKKWWDANDPAQKNVKEWAKLEARSDDPTKIYQALSSWETFSNMTRAAQSNQNHGIDISILQFFPQVEGLLAFNDGSVTPKISAGFEVLKNLKHIRKIAIICDGDFATSLKSLTHITELELICKNPIDLNFLRRWNSLRSLSIQHDGQDPFDIAKLPDLPSLQRFFVRGNMVNWKKWQVPHDLRELDIRGGEISGLDLDIATLLDCLVLSRATIKADATLSIGTAELVSVSNLHWPDGAKLSAKKLRTVHVDSVTGAILPHVLALPTGNLEIRCSVDSTLNIELKNSHIHHLTLVENTITDLAGLENLPSLKTIAARGQQCERNALQKIFNSPVPVIDVSGQDLFDLEIPADKKIIFNCIRKFSSFREARVAYKLHKHRGGEDHSFDALGYLNSHVQNPLDYYASVYTSTVLVICGLVLVGWMIFSRVADEFQQAARQVCRGGDGECG